MDNNHSNRNGHFSLSPKGDNTRTSKPHESTATNTQSNPNPNFVPPPSKPKSK